MESPTIGLSGVKRTNFRPGTNVQRRVLRGLLFLLAITTAAPSLGADWISDRPARGAFALAADGRAADILYDSADHAVVARAAADLAADIARVNGVQPKIQTAVPAGSANLVLIGTLNSSEFIDELVRRGKLDVRSLKGAWESFVIHTVVKPMPGIDSALVIVGSDQRGTAFGAYELSEAIGVSPWYWWADVPPQHRAALYVAAGTRRFGPPSVKYRGIFLNDEDWGLQPWAARTFEPATGDIGPKTYARVFELLLRLKANTLWPAMHKVTAPFNRDPRNAKLADDYAIVMGSSHAEPMLRNNVGEWTDAPERFNYATNPNGVRTYWNERVKTNARYESLWTLGMRGIHDSGMTGGATVAERAALLERIFADQREMLAAHVNPDIERVPQMFMPYKEVLDIYRAGLNVPRDVTIVWPDDNFGYIRQLPSATERSRPGGSGVYYHLSYLGAPLSYLWLSTTPPALIQTEMTRAWDAGARTLWIANVGDLKPAEIGTTLFLEMAWDIDRWRSRTQREFLDDWARRTFGTERAIGEVLDAHFRLNFERRPEHLQWWLPGERPRNSTLSEDEIALRLARFDSLIAALDRIAPALRSDQADAFFELIDYPVRAAALANRRYFAAERYAKLINDHPAQARSAAAVANATDAEIKAMTRRFNEEVAGGKWRYIMAEEPADNQWKTFRTSPLALPAPGMSGPVGPNGEIAQSAGAGIANAKIMEVETFTRNRGWRFVQGLGRGDGTMASHAPAARLDYRVTVPKEGTWSLALGLIPNYPPAGQQIEVAIDDEAAHDIVITRNAEGTGWAQAVLDNILYLPASGTLSAGTHRISVSTDGEGVLLDRLLLVPETSRVATE
jgi:hypothetical protein